MRSTRWTLLQTAVVGRDSLRRVLAIAAQGMIGPKADGEPFIRLLRPTSGSSDLALGGYERDVLERDGVSPAEAYRELATYVQDRPLVAFDRARQVEDVLQAEQARHGIAPFGSGGFCLMQLAQRLLDPIPAANCKLQTLRQLYQLPEREMGTALGDLQTVVDLVGQVLWPLAEKVPLQSFAELADFAHAPWFPSRIAFGKFKGRHFQDAHQDKELRAWLESLATSVSGASAEMGAWYLAQLAAGRGRVTASGVVVYQNLELAELERQVADARAQLAELESEHTSTLHAVNVTQARLFALVRPHYERRDRLQLIVDYRRRFLRVLLREGEDAADEVAGEYEEARHASGREYEDAARAAAGREALTDEAKQELQALWKKLVRVHHPDRFATDPQKLESYTRLTKEINHARDTGDIAKLREIAADPNAFMLRHGLGRLNFTDDDDLASLKKLLEAIKVEIVKTIEALDELKADPKYELHKLVSLSPGYLEEGAGDVIAAIKGEIATLEGEAASLQTEIDALVSPGVRTVA
jgi:hypothetical protein